MERLAISFAQWRKQLAATAAGATPRLEAVVIGSGYGGSVSALRLAEMGIHVTVLERGSEFRPGDFPADLSQLPKFVRAPSPDGQRVTGRANGLFEWRAGPGVLSLVSNGLGGGSLINAGVVMRPDRDVFAQAAWPGAIRLPAGLPAESGVDPLPMERWFRCAEAELRGAPWRPAAPARKTTAFEGLARTMRYPTEPHEAACASAVSVTIDPLHCIRCGDCATGCNVPHAKLTLCETYLKAARARGATLVHGGTVWTVAPRRDAEEDPHAPASRWRLRVLETACVSRWQRWSDAAQSEGFEIDADLIVLAAGTFGSTELLQRSRDRAGERWWIPPALGNRFSGNGDGLSFVAGDPAHVNAVGVGADRWLAEQPPRADVGPTITAQIDLRQAPNRQPIPLIQRLTVQDAAVPGAIARLFAEAISTGRTLARLERWSTELPAFEPQGAPAHDPLAAGHDRRGQAGAELNRAALSQHTQVLLAMGHDESRGRIVWVPGRDASVPYWEAPQELETYRLQEKLFRASAKQLRADWVPNPAWRLLPEAATELASGPMPSHLLTTVHPLGGCVMGDDPTQSVVDDVGRLWRSDRRDCAATADSQREPQVWPRHENFLVLDGAIVPTSLGVNPLLTITALAERAMHALAERRSRVASAAIPSVQAQSSPVAAAAASALAPAFVRARAQTWSAAMRERLVCEPLVLKGSLARALGSDRAGGELQVEFTMDDWLQTWEEALHPQKGLGGSLRLQVSAPSGPAVATYRIGETLRCEIFAVSPYGAWAPPRLRWIFKLLPWLRTALTYAILRPDVLRPCAEPGSRSTTAQWLEQGIPSGLRQIVHSAERRSMDYELRLELDCGAEDGADGSWTAAWHAALPEPAALPRELILRGVKRVEYPATWTELGCWSASRLWRALQRGPKRSEALPPLRETFFEQASHLTVQLADARGIVARGRFLMDFSAWLRHPPFRLGPTGDLTGGLAALAAYAGLLIRFLLKTRLPDFRAPQYGRVPPPDMASADVLALRPAPAGAPAPVRHSLWVPRGTSSNDRADSSADAELELVLWRYARPGGELPELSEGHWYGQPVQRVRCALLVHAFAQSGYVFTLNTLDTNLAGELYRANYEVWVLEHRLSTRLPAHQQPSTLDQLAQIDLPAAVNHVLAALKADFDGSGPAGRLQHPQIHVFAQCIGAASLAMSLLSGRLHYSDVIAPGESPLSTPRCPKLASAILSQAHPLCIGQPGAQARTWIPSAVRDAVGRSTVPFGVREPASSLLEAWLDRCFAALPVPIGEECPPAVNSEDDCATCRRVRFLEAPLFKHRNLSPETHRQLPLLFGEANVGIFAHAAKCLDAERLVDNDGRPIYVSEENVRAYAALPVAFLHGEENELFHPDSARQSAKLFRLVHPEWAALASLALPAPGRGKSDDRPAWMVPGHGHLDVLIGARAPELVFAGVAEFFDRIQRETDQGDVRRLAALQVGAAARAPRVGPLLGPLRARTRKHAAGGERTEIAMRVSFMVDDRFSDAKHGPRGRPGTRTWAYARVHAGNQVRTHRLRIARRRASASDLGSPDAFEPGDGYPAYRFAVGALTLDAAAWPPGTDVRIEAFSVHECAMNPGPDGYALALDDALRPGAPPDPGDGPFAQADSRFERWLEALLEKSEQRLRRLAGARLPLPTTASRVRLEAEPVGLRWAHVPAASIAAALSTLRVPGQAEAAPECVHFLAACCRYPGFPVDRHRAEHSVQRVLNAVSAADPAQQPAFALLLGDQIYADATAGAADPLSPTERFVERHRAALSRALAGEPPRLGDLLARLPAAMIPDDHEYADAYPAGAPLVPARPALVAQVQGVATRTATDAWRYFQSSCAGGGTRGWLTFEAGPLRVLALDTRRNRQPAPRSIFSDAQRARIQNWLSSKESLERLNLIATGSVLLPGLLPDCDPANPAEPDTFQWSPQDRRWLLTQLAEACRLNPKSFRCVLLSGDYHVSQMSVLQLDGEAVGVSIVAPPVYSPMPYMDAPPHALFLSERMAVPMANGTTATWSLVPAAGQRSRPVWTGSAIAELRVRRMPESSGSLYEVRCEQRPVDYAQGTGSEPPSIPPITV